MRQAGILAAAGIVALTEMTERLAEDHANARALAEGLADMAGLAVDLANSRTNIVFVHVTRPALTAQDLADRLAAQGIRLLALGPQMLRAVTHYQVTRADIAHTLRVLARTIKTLG